MAAVMHTEVISQTSENSFHSPDGLYPGGHLDCHRTHSEGKNEFQAEGGMMPSFRRKSRHQGIFAGLVSEEKKEVGHGKTGQGEILSSCHEKCEWDASSMEYEINKPGVVTLACMATNILSNHTHRYTIGCNQGSYKIAGQTT